MMKKITLALLSVGLLSSCYRSAEMIIINEIPDVEIDNIRFDDKKISCCLMTGDQDNIEIRLRSDENQLESKLHFIMRSNEEAIKLRTKETYLLQNGDWLNISLTRSTLVEIDE
jgi:hypothetical protein